MMRYSYLFFISDLNQIPIQNAISHSMIGTLEIILVVTGVISIAMIVINYFNSKNQKKLSIN